MATRFRSQTLQFFLATTQGKTYTITFLTGLLLLVMIFIALLPAASAIVAQVAENKERQAALAEMNQKLTSIRALSANEQTNRAYSVALTDILPNGFDQASVLAELLSMADQADVNLTTYRTANSTDSNPPILRELGALGNRIGVANITLVVEGGRGQLEGLVNQLETSFRVINIKTMTMSLITQQDEIFAAGTAFRLTLSAEVFYWKLPAES